MSLNDLAFKKVLKMEGLPLPVTEYTFHPTRKWRFDYAWPDQMVALEVEGGVWRKGGGAHQGAGTIRDIEKYNEAVLLGWRLVRVVPKDLTVRKTFDMIKALLTDQQQRQTRRAPGR